MCGCRPLTLAVDELAVTVRFIKLDADQADLEQATKCGIPHLGQFLYYVRMLQSGEEEAYGRRYQIETIRHGELRLPSPFTGEFVSSTRSFVVPKSVIFYFRGAPDFYVAASRLSQGYPLNGVFLPCARLMVVWDEGKKGPRSLGIRHLQDLMAQRALDSSPTGTTRLTAIMGSDNFAHHLWNELSALENLLSKYGTGPLAELVVRSEPLGRIERIFPEIAHLRIHRGQHTPTPGTLYVRLGGYRISEAARNRLLQHARREASEAANTQIRRIKEAGGPVFWLSVRTHNPTLQNQREVISAICRRLLGSCAACTILLDGFSLPEHWSAVAGDRQESYHASAEASRIEIDAIIRELSSAKVRNFQQVINIGGIRLLDSISLAELADVYFCHAGSVQHKIAWTANKPGIIHTYRKQMLKNPVSWHAERLDGAVPPLALPVNMIEDVESDAREKNYRADPEAVSQFVTNYFSWHVGRS